MIKKIKERFNEFNPLNLSNLETEEFDSVEFQSARRTLTFKFICLFGVFYLIIFSVIAFYENRRLVTIIDFVMATVLALIIVRVRKTRKTDSNKMIFAAVFSIGLFFIYLFFSSHMKSDGFFWYFIYPLLAFFLMGTRMGGIMSSLLIVSTLLISLFVNNSYPRYFFVRFCGAYIAIGILSMAFEMIRAATEARLVLNYRKINSMLRDLSEAQHAFRESHKRYQDLVETVNDWIWEVDKNGLFVYSSPQVKNILGYQPEEILGKTFSEMAPNNLKAKTEKIREKLREEKKGVEGLEVKLMHRNGDGIVLETNAIPVLDEKDNLLGFRGVTRDITVRNEAQEEQAERKKLQGALELAGAVCHELNQPMMAVSGYAELLLGKEGMDASIVKPLENIQQQTARMGAITRKLMSITRYETRDYTGGEKIMDINKSSELK